MEITSLRFIALAVLSIFIYYLLSHRYRTGFLVLLSCGFIASFSLHLLLYVVIYALINFLIGINIPGSKQKKLLFRAGIVINITQLIVLKYSSFALDPILDILGVNVHVVKLSHIIVPIGVSYFTLQGIGYLINVKMSWEKPESSFLSFLLYFIFFPKFLSGPVERSNHFLGQLKNVKTFNRQDVTDGLRLILFGLFKKLAIANQLAPYVNNFYANIDTAQGTDIWMLIVIQPLFLYFDFSGYTDIALGLAKTYGINLIPNFNRPFLAENVTNFWKRFHISLSSWFNDYVFKQTSFQYRKWGVYSSVWAMLLTWTLFGIWHGAGWSFMFLGLLQAIAILYEFFTKKWRSNIFSALSPFFRLWSGRVITYIFYGVSLLFFFAPDLRSAIILFPRLFKENRFILEGVRLESFVLALVLVVGFIAVEVIENDSLKASERIKAFWSSTGYSNKVSRWALYFVAITIIIVFSNEVQEFIYFQF